ncbi:hypothetical protein FF011L_47150 [Roseimaritima multifibrata]|uniref:Reverse transcriptase (RNA-dependent DNA polymerase) n=1 Tax=Roseimaritima multifibrata TaxID=1930274 RepID=A0A517MLZ8_9BACT|nr:RNA-directed DNA polymerase [Roseimaritima multifibrata]QDS95914.1 hypothetical protein FF011L_47150 [Roseimaritima multifibrata]
MAKRSATTRMKGLPKKFFDRNDLFVAYRKAKQDVFQEKTQANRLAFSEYEKHLNANLETLHSRLTSRTVNWFRDLNFIGDVGFIPKDLHLASTASESESEPHFSQSDPDESWKRQIQAMGGENPTVSFRPMAAFTVDMYIVCTLWVNRVGAHLDACLDNTAKGSRLRRHQRSEETGTIGGLHLDAIGSFPPYYYAYKEWRDDGLKAIRLELEEDRKVIAITMDLTSFYHRIDAGFLLDDAFLEAVRFQELSGHDLTNEERLFTRQLVRAFANWGEEYADSSDAPCVGIPVGPSAPRVIANVLLAEFDQLVQQKLDPIYYARYVDDIFLVIRDHGQFNDGKDVLSHLCERIEPLDFNDDGQELHLKLRYAKDSQLVFQAKKQRIFALSGEIGHDLLDTIQSKIDEISSEWRLLPDLDVLETSPAARALAAGKRPNEDVNTLRKADDLSLNRLSFANLLRDHDQLLNYLPPSEWRSKRHEFYKFAERNVLSPSRVFGLVGYFPRLFGLAVACRDWKQAESLLKRTVRSLTTLKETTTLLTETKTSDTWKKFALTLGRVVHETLIQCYPLSGKKPSDARSVNLLAGQISELLGFESDSERLLIEQSRELFWTDLGRVPFKDGILGYMQIPKCPLPSWEGGIPDEQRERHAAIREFVKSVGQDVKKTRPLLLPTRPLSVAEITELDQSTVSDLTKLKKFVHAIRGTWVRPANDHEDGDWSTATRVTIGLGERKRQPRIAITSLAVGDSSWAMAAAGKPDLSASRYKCLTKLVNSIIKSKTRPDYVLLPELSVPRRWLPGIASKLLRQRISLIAGAEYRYDKSVVFNEAAIYLVDNRVGYASAHTVIWQQKGLPAHHEREELRSKFGLKLAEPQSSRCLKRVYNHFGFEFGTLICSELTDIEHRQIFRGQVDGLFVLSWNQDLESFGSLIESASLDVHCFMALVNNRKYGDSRVRAPYKDAWERERARIKGGMDDYFVIVELDIDAIRDFHSHQLPPLGDRAKFKPTPEGFKISKSRKRIPGT